MTERDKTLAALSAVLRDRSENEPSEPDASVRRLAALIKEQRGSQSRFRSKEEVISRLKRLRETYIAEQSFEEGDIVVWKEGMKNRLHPAYGEPVIVMERLDPPEMVDRDTGTPYFREPLSVKLGWLDDDDEFACFHYDGNRFQKLEPAS